MALDTDKTDVETDAAFAFAARRGVYQDFAYVFLTTAGGGSSTSASRPGLDYAQAAPLSRNTHQRR